MPDPNEQNTSDTPPPPTAPPLRDGNNRWTSNPELAFTDARAAELRAEGWTLQQIADDLGYAHKTGARDAIRRAVRTVVRGPAEKLIELEAARLDTLYEEALAVLERDHLTVSHGKVIRDDDGNVLLDDGPKLAALREMRMIRESYRRLYGLDRPVKVDATVHQVTQQDVELQEMLREAKAAMRAEEQQIRDGGADD